MHSIFFPGQHQQVGPPSQAAPHVVQDASRSWSANYAHQYMTANSGVQPSQSVNFATQNGVYPNGQMANLQSSEGLHLAQSKNCFPQVTCGPQISTLQHSQQYSVNQSSPSPSSANTTYLEQNMSASWSQSVTVNQQQNVSNLNVQQFQQNRDSHNFYPSLTRSNSSYTTSAPSRLQQLMFNPGSFVSAASQNVQTSQRVSNQNFIPVYVQNEHFSVYTQNCSMGTSQSFGSVGAAPQSFSNGQAAHFSNTSQMSRQPATLLNSLHYNGKGSTNSRNANLNEQYKSNSFLKETNELPINSAGAQNQEGVVSLGNSYTINNGYHFPPPSYDSHRVDLSRMSNQNVQPMTSAHSESYNLNATQPVSLDSRPSLPQSITSRGHLTANPHPQQNTLPEAFNVNKAEGRGEREKAVNVSLPSGNAVPKRCLTSSPSDGSQVKRTPDQRSRQKKDFDTFLKNHPQLSQMLGVQYNDSPAHLVKAHTSTPDKRSRRKKDLDILMKHHPQLFQILGVQSAVQHNDSAAHSVKAPTSTRAVAVVPPLSQDDRQTTSNSSTCNYTNATDKQCITPDIAKETARIEETNLDQEMLTPVGVNKASSNSVAVLIGSGCERRGLPRSSEQDHLSPTPQKCSEVSPSQTSPGKQSGMATSPSPPVFELSSLPTNAWRIEALTNLISVAEKSQCAPKDLPSQSAIVKIMILFWDKNTQTFLQSYKASMQSEFFSYIEKLCTYITKDTVILSQVKPELKDSLEQFHVLKDDEVYSEQPYKSFWLNLNDRLDDMDKEFGFPWTLKPNPFVQDTYSQMHMDDLILEPVANEAQNKVPSQPEPGLVNLTEENEAPAVVNSSIPPMSPDESGDTSSDLRYAFKINVLPSEEAKAIYEQVQKQINQGTKCEAAMISSISLETEKDNDTNATLTSNTKNKSTEKIGEFCCLSKLMEMYSLPVESPCKCLSKDEVQSRNGSTVDPDAENPPKSKDHKTITIGLPQLISKLDQIIDFLDDDDNFHLPSSEMSPAITQTSNSSQINVITISDSEDEDIFTNAPDISNEIIKIQSEDESQEEEMESTGTVQASPSASSMEQKENEELCSTEAEEILQMSDHEENYEQILIKAAEEAVSPFESEENVQTTYQTSLSRHVQKKPEEMQKRKGSPDQFSTGLKTAKKCKRSADLDLLDAPEAQPAASEKPTVELVLFGSGRNERHSFSGNKKISSQRVPYFKDNPPEVLSVNMCSSRTMQSDAGHTENYSVKSLIYERWRKSFPTPNGSVVSGRKNKLKRQKHHSASRSSTSSKVERQSVSEFKTSERKHKSILNLKKRRSSSYLRRLDEAKRSYSVTLGQPASQEVTEDQGGHSRVMPLRENIVLKFNVLPNTFSFKDGSNQMEAADPMSDKTKLVDEKDESPEKTTAMSKGLWRSTPAHQHQPFDAPKTVGLFYEYQKKYKEKTRSPSGESIDK